MKVPVSIIIPARNEGHNLDRCLRSVRWAAEVYVVDSASTDETCKIARLHGAKTVQFDYHGGWPKKKNWALRTLPLENEWVLLLDADEILMADAQDEIRSAVAAGDALRGYWINRRFMFLGKWLRHAYYPNWNLRLFKHAHGSFERLVEGETNSGDVEIHEHVIVNGSTGRLTTEIQHFPFPSIEAFIEKHNRYSNWEAQLQLEQRKCGASLQHGRVNFRRRLKRWSRKFPMRPLLRFSYVYFVQRGFLDGVEGYYFSQLHACYEWMSVIKTYERRLRADRRLGN
ncbi:MAG TPA: glycosyltransferase family 2 protein [Chthoniobacterales bacterium]